MPKIDVRQKGNQWERDLAKLLESKIVGSVWKRIPGSGAFGTMLNMGSLTSDLIGTIPFTKKSFKVEAKVGYGGDKQITIKKEWFDKVKMEAAQDYSIPLVGCKFSGSREGVKCFISMDLDTFCELMNSTTDIYDQLTEALDKLNKV